MIHDATRASKRIKERIERYNDNPLKSPTRVDAVRAITTEGDEKKMARRTPAQKRATAKMIKANRARKRRRPRRKASAALQANPRRARRRRARPRRRRQNSAAALLQNLQPLMENARRRGGGYAAAAAAELEENRRRPRRRKRRARPRRRRALQANARRRTRKNPVRRNPVRRNPTHVVFAGNPWYNDHAGHSRAAKKGYRRKRRKSRQAARRRASRRTPFYARVRSRRRSNALMQANPAMLQNPALMPNQLLGAFTRANLMAYGTAAAGVAVGLLVADFADRYVATRKPADSTNGTAAIGPWFGRDAAAAQRMRPDAWRLAAQAGGAVVALGLAYWSRGKRLLPWLLGGTAIGFGANLLKMLADWWLMPAIFKTKADNEASFANRMYPLEQSAIQDQVAEIFKNWGATASLAAGQLDPPVVVSPLNPPGSSDVYTLGRGRTPLFGMPGQQGGAGVSAPRSFIQTGRLGNCPSCNGHNGCYDDCATLCPECPGYQPNKKCQYTVVRVGELEELAAQAGVSMNDVAAMNGGRIAYAVGDTVVLPYGMCMILQGPGITTTLTPQQVITPGGPVVTTDLTPSLIAVPTTGPTYAATPPTTVPGGYSYVRGTPENGNENGTPKANGNGSHAQSSTNSIWSIGATDE